MTKHAAIGKASEQILRANVPADDKIDVWPLDGRKELYPPASWAGKYDAVMANGVLQCSADQNIPEVLSGWRRCLRPDGEICIMAPSLEWAAQQIRAEHPSPLTLVHLYGPTLDGLAHLTGFTMRRLRSLVEQAGFAVTLARVNQYTAIVDGTEMPADVLTVIAVRKELPEPYHAE